MLLLFWTSHSFVFTTWMQRQHVHCWVPSLLLWFWLRFKGKLIVAQLVFPLPQVTEIKISMERTTEWDVNVCSWKHIKLKAFGLVRDCMVFSLCTDIWPLFITCTLHHWNSVSYLLNSGTNGWLVHIMLLTAWRCLWMEERGDGR